MARSTLTSKGQITIPKPIRDRLALERGDVLEFKISATGEVIVRKIAEKRLGVLKDFAKEKPVSVEEMSAAVRRRAARKASSGSP